MNRLTPGSDRHSDAAATTLWHFTCEHGFAGLGERGKLGLNPHPLLPKLGQVAWLTSDPTPERDAVGLTSSLLMCDRMAYRYRVESPSRCIPWTAVRHLAAPEVLHDLESFGAPETWWIAREPVWVTLDQLAEVAA
jgi:hypothetical protein